MYVYIFFPLIILTDFFVADVISTVEFNQTGDLLATGDKGGSGHLPERDRGRSDCEQITAVMD